MIITKNEIESLGRCLDSVPFADEIVVVDSGSNDGTVELARSRGALVLQTADWPGFGIQKNRALAVANGSWILSLDADEWLGDELAASIEKVISGAADEFSAFRFARLSSFCGKWMRHGGWYPDHVTRLFRRDAAKFSEAFVHESLKVDGRTGTIAGDLLHESIRNLEIAVDKANRYSTGTARDLIVKGASASVMQAVVHGFWTFFRTFVLRAGFLDGKLGFMLAVSNAEGAYYKYAKVVVGQIDHGITSLPRQRRSKTHGGSDA